MATISPLYQFINDELSFGKSTDLQIISPWDNQVLAQGKESSHEDLAKAMEFAKKAQLEWENTPLGSRCEIMYKVRSLMLDQIDFLAQLASKESGKIFGEAKAGLLNGIEIIEFACSLKNMELGAKSQVGKNVTCEFIRAPLGITAGITPFNFPAMVPMWMVPISLCLGNAFIWKPSEKASITAIEIAKIFAKAGLPKGLLTVLLGGPKIVNDLLEHPEIKAIGFVGSTPVAKKVYQKGCEFGKRVLALGGAKNHIILLPDADFDLTTSTIVDSFTGCAGQRCMAASVLLAVGDKDNDEQNQLINQHIEKIVAMAKSKKCGETLGAVIDKKSLKRLEDSIEKFTSGSNPCGKLILDGRRPKMENYQEGNWLAPTIIDFVKPDSPLSCEELFGPILAIIRCKTLEEALRIEEKNPYGNAASVFTQSGKMAQYVTSRVKSSMIGVNVALPVPKPPFSFGGMNDSKFGTLDITGTDGISFWTYQRKITSRW